ncbi:hypothetical protein C8R46DRAFT_1233774 [Mycena filopes]|nr:hypothetical protein C8R46DRAFT_1233774 [Mycena filopes]
MSAAQSPPALIQPELSFALSDIARLFTTAIEAIRKDTPNVEPQAIEWLKAARHALIRDIEKAYYTLEQSRNTPLTQPAWAADPTRPLLLWTDVPPAVLRPYSAAMATNLLTLLKDCGFTRVEGPFKLVNGTISFGIRFPSHGSRPPSPDLSRLIHLEDEFSNSDLPLTGTLFSRLLREARKQTAAKSAPAAAARKTSHDAGSTDARESVDETREIRRSTSSRERERRALPTRGTNWTVIIVLLGTVLWTLILHSEVRDLKVVVTMLEIHQDGLVRMLRDARESAWA